jgi:ribosomal-protein-alanine N-acetyltransferase
VAETVELVTERLVLWLPAPDAASRMLRFQEDNVEHLKRWSPPSPPGWGAIAYWERKLAANIDDFAAGRSVRLAIAWKDDDERRIIGTISLTEIVRGPLQQAYLGYALDHRHEGKGVMSEGVRAVCDYAFETTRLHRISANYMPTNDRSARVLRRCGFTPIGYARDYLFIDGAWRDHVLTSLVDPKGRPPA